MLINIVPAKSITWNADPAATYEIRCNNTYGESRNGYYISPGSDRAFFLFFWDLGGAIGDRLYYMVMGRHFVWQGWMILLLPPLLLVGLAFLLVVLYVYNRSRRKGP
jgi:hypothetical protein